MFGWFRKRNKQEQQAAASVSQAAPALEHSAPQTAPATEPAPLTSTQLPPQGYAHPTGPAVEPPTEPVTQPEALESAEPAQQERDDHEPASAAPTDQPQQATSEEPAAIAVADKSEDQEQALVPAPSARPAMPLSAHPNFAGFGLTPSSTEPPRMLQPEAALSPAAQQELHRLFDDMFGPTGRYRLEWRTDRELGDDAMFASMMAQDLVRRVQNAVADVEELERPTPLRAITAGEKSRSNEHDEDATTADTSEAA